MMWLFLLTSLVWGQQNTQDLQPVYLNFGGINNYLDSTRIPDNDAQAAENVLTDQGFLEKRPGNIRSATVLSGFPVRYLKEFISPSGTHYLITHSSTTLYQTSFSGNISSITTISDAEITGTTAFKRHYIANGADPLFYFDGSASATVSGSPPLCTYIEFADERLYCGNTNSSPSQVAVSSFGADSGWTIPATLTADAATSFKFNDNDGEGITCLKVTPWGKFVGKQHSLYVLKGYDNNTYYKQTLDPQIGCVDNRSIQYLDGNLIWLGRDAIYSWDGSASIQNISRDIETTVLSIRQLNSNSAFWLVSTQGDFNNGINESNGPSNSWNLSAVPGSIVPSTSGFLDTNSANFTSGTIVSVPFSTYSIPSLSTTSPLGSLTLSVTTMGFTNATMEAGDLSNWTIVNQPFNFYFTTVSATNMYGNFVMRFEDCDFYATFPDITVDLLDFSNNAVIAEFSKNGSYGITQTTLTVSASTASQAYLQIKSAGGYKIKSPSFYAGQSLIFMSSGTVSKKASAGCVAAGGDPNNSRYFFFDMNDAFDNRLTSGSFTSRSFDTAFSTPTFGPFSVTETTSSSYPINFRTQTSSDNSTWNSLVVASAGEKPTSASQRYIRYVATFTASDTNATSELDDVTMSAVSTGVFRSDVHYVGTKISSWSFFNATDNQIPTGRVTYQVRTATYNFSATDNTIVWSTQTNNVIVSTSVNPYYQWRAISSIQSTTETIQIDQVLTRWTEGINKPVASGILNHRYFLAVTTSANSSNNDTVLVYQKNGRWTMFTGPQYYSMGTYSNELYAGDASTNSYVWKTMQSGTYNDDGSPIAARWVTKDFSFGAPFRRKALLDLWAESNVSSFAGATVNIGFAANKSTNTVSKSVAIDGSSFIINARVPSVDGNYLGKYFRFLISDSTKDEYFSFNSLGAFLNLQPMRRDDSE